MHASIRIGQCLLRSSPSGLIPPPLLSAQMHSRQARGAPMSAFSWDTDLRQSSPMNGASTPQSAARPRSGGGHLAHASTGSDPISPKSVKGKIKTPIKRKHEQQEQESSSADSADDAAGGRAGRGRQPGVKRACNECRQQKVSHPHVEVEHQIGKD